jgi:hypothetical protein
MILEPYLARVHRGGWREPRRPLEPIPGARATAPRWLQGAVLLPLLTALPGARGQTRTNAPRLQGAVLLSRAAPRVNIAADEPPPPLMPLRDPGGPEDTVCAAAAAVLTVIATARSSFTTICRASGALTDCPLKRLRPKPPPPRCSTP